MFDALPLQLFQLDVKVAIEDYRQNLAWQGKEASDRVRLDILQLEYLLALPWESLEKCRTKVSAYVDAMPAGFWIFPTDRAPLKRLINEIVDIHAADSPLKTESEEFLPGGNARHTRD